MKNNMKNPFILALLVSLIINSCGFVKVMSVTISTDKRKYDTQEDINKKFNKYDISTSNSFYLSKTGDDSLSMMPFVVNMYKYRRDSTLDSASPLQVRIYNSFGEIYMNWEQCFGPLNSWEIFDTYPPKATLNVVENKRINILNDIRLIEANNETKKSIINISKKKQYTFFIFYANWMGLYTNQVLKKMNAYQQKYSDDIQVVYINTSTCYK